VNPQHDAPQPTQQNQPKNPDEHAATPPELVAAMPANAGGAQTAPTESPVIDASDQTPGGITLAHDMLVSDDTPVDPGAQRRKCPRVAFTTEIVVHFIDQADSVADGLRCVGVDLSAGGLCFRSRRSFWAGDRLLIIIRTKQRSARVVFGAVRHCAYEGNGQCRVGVQFIESPKSKRLLTWLSENVVE
jgi:hypothetical protein